MNIRVGYVSLVGLALLVHHWASRYEKVGVVGGDDCSCKCKRKKCCLTVGKPIVLKWVPHPPSKKVSVQVLKGKFVSAVSAEAVPAIQAKVSQSEVVKGEIAKSEPTQAVTVTKGKMAKKVVHGDEAKSHDTDYSSVEYDDYGDGDNVKEKKKKKPNPKKKGSSDDDSGSGGANTGMGPNSGSVPLEPIQLINGQQQLGPNLPLQNAIPLPLTIQPMIRLPPNQFEATNALAQQQYQQYPQQQQFLNQLPVRQPQPNLGVNLLNWLGIRNPRF